MFVDYKISTLDYIFLIILSDEMENMHKVVLLHIKIRWLSGGKLLCPCLIWDLNNPFLS